jgi:hypothetical protein
VSVDPFGNKTGAGPTGNFTQEAVLGDNHVFSSTSIAEVRFSYLENYNFQDPLSNGFNMSTINSQWGRSPASPGSARSRFLRLQFRDIASGQTFPNCTGTITSGLSTEVSPRS